MIAQGGIQQKSKKKMQWYIAYDWNSHTSYHIQVLLQMCLWMKGKLETHQIVTEILFFPPWLLIILCVSFSGPKLVKCTLKLEFRSKLFIFNWSASGQKHRNKIILQVTMLILSQLWEYCHKCCIELEVDTWERERLKISLC